MNNSSRRKKTIDQDVINRDLLLKSVDGKTEMAEQRLQQFIRNAPLMIDEIKEACSENDCEYVSIYGHTIMDASEKVSAEAMKDVGFDIQIAGKSGNIKLVKPLIKKLEQEFKKLKDLSFINL